MSSFREKRVNLAASPSGNADRYKVQVRTRPSRLQGIGQDTVIKHGLDGWTMKRAPDGVAYYHHDIIGTQYERPLGFDMETGGGSSVPETIPLALLTPNSRRQQLKKILSWQKYQSDASHQNIANNSNVPAMPEDTGSFCEHIVTCRCDWLDWSCLCSGISIIVGFILWLVEVSAERDNTPNHTAGLLMMLIPIGMWALCVGVPYIAFNTTLGRSRW